MREQNSKSYFFLLLSILAVKALLMMAFIAYGPIGLGSDEAQYWTWSQQLDWGYYSKPPGIAWEILFGTLFLGNTELGVRLGAILVSFALSLAVYALARCCQLKPSTAFWSALIMAFSPLGLLASLFATTDGGFVLFWTLGCCVLAYALSTQTRPHYYLLAIFILLGALFKWPIYLLWVLALGCCWLYPNMRSWHFIGGILLSTLGLLPSIIWNYSRNWPTFRHVWNTNIVGSSHPKATATASTPFFHGNFLDFIGAQAGLLSPLLFLLFILSFIFLYRERKNIKPALLFCGGSSLLLLSFYSAASLVQKMQGNWVAFAYPTGIVWLGWYLCEKMKNGKAWLVGGLALSVILASFVLALPAIQTHSLLKKTPIPFTVNPFRECLGWDRLPQALQEVGYDPARYFLFGDRYQMTSSLSFYAPGQKRAYFLNLKGFRKNQFSFWPGMAQEQKGKDGIFAATLYAPFEGKLDKDIATYQNRLQEYFQTIKFLGVKPLFDSYGKTTKALILFECTNYNGKEPPELAIY